MNKAGKATISKIISISLFIIFLVSCVETDKAFLPESVDFNSEIAIANFSNSSVSFDVVNNADTNHKDYGKLEEQHSLAVGNLTVDGFEVLPSGRKRFLTASQDTFTLSYITEKRMRFYFYTNSNSELKLASQIQRYTWQTKDTPEGDHLFHADTTSISIANFVTGADIHGYVIGGTDTTHFADGIATGSFTGYGYFNAPQNYIVELFADSIKTTVNLSAAEKGRYTIAVYGDATSIAAKTLTDD